MTPHYQDATVTLHHGDCLDVLRDLPEASVDSIVTDPPYGLGFMGKAWDELPPGLPWAQECLRVLKPGGHLLAFGGTRTWHRLACAVEDAGFEIRDGLAWLYGSGFPKSLDVSKAIDKRPGVTRHAEFAQHLAERRSAAGMSRAEVSERVVGSRTGACWNWEHHQFPEMKWWPALRDLLDLDEQTWGPVIAEASRAVVGQRTTGIGTGGGSTPIMRDGNRDITTASTDAAQRWQGWGTALKPAFEPVVMGRKPLEGTVAANVLEHGTGALNIDGCRVGFTSDADKASARPGGKATSLNGALAGKAQSCERNGSTGPSTPAETRDTSTNSSTGSASNAPTTPLTSRTEFEVKQGAGRWPANVILDESQAAELDAQSGNLVSGMMRAGTPKQGKPAGILGEFKPQPTINDTHGDAGGASRFFYVAKADSSERVKVDGVAHPTVKPLDIMRWLVRLVTPPGGTVLEPFAGSGTTVEACILEGFRCIAIEREEDYLPLIVQRIHRRRDPVAAVRATGDDAGLFDLLEGA